MSKSCQMPCYTACLIDGFVDTEPLLPPYDLKRISVSKSFYRADDQLVRDMWRKLTPLAADLLDIGAGVFLFDCSSPRRVKESGRRSRSAWQRDMELIVPVREFDRWENPQVRKALADALEFVTGDYRWSLGFESHSGPKRSAETYNPIEFDRTGRICLYSEGIDSFCGLAKCLSDHPEDHVFAISAIMHTQHKPRVQASLDSLRQQYGMRIEHLPVLMHRKVHSRTGQDHHQRTRSFLLLLLAAAVAVMLGRDEVEIYENGLECFNLPLKSGALNAQESRMMHPLFLHRMSDLLTLLLGRPFRFHAPNLMQTKGDMLKCLPDTMRQCVAGHTLSCMRFRRPNNGSRHCGICPGCLLRRVSLKVAGCPDADTDYRCSSQELCLTGDRLGASDFDLMHSQVSKLDEILEQEDWWEAFLQNSGVGVIDWDDFTLALGHHFGENIGATRTNLYALYRRYIREWESIYGVPSHFALYSDSYILTEGKCI